MPYSLTAAALSMRLAAVAFVGGLAFFHGASLFHPSDSPPHVSHLAFAEYARSAAWTDAHVGQFLGLMLLVLGFAGLRERLRNDAGVASALSAPAILAAGAALAVLAVLQAVDGPALKHVVDRWAAAPEAEAAAAFRVAEAVRWVEIGLNSYFRILLGLTLALFGAAIAAGTLLPRWLGALGVVAGAGSVWQGLHVGHYGFDATVLPVVAAPTLLYFGWFLAASVLLWRDAGALARGGLPEARLPAE